MQKQKNFKMLVVITLLISIFGVTMAFAAMSKSLTINGSAMMDTAKWEITVENLTLLSSDNASELSTPKVEGTSIKDISVELRGMNASLYYTFDIKNNGTIDAILSNITESNASYELIGSTEDGTQDFETVKNGLVYKLYYADGTPVGDSNTEEENKKLESGETKTLKLEILYSNTVTLRKDVKVKNLDINMVFSQVN